MSLVRKIDNISSGQQNQGRLKARPDTDDMLVSAEAFVRFVGGEYEAVEAAQGRLRKVLALAEEKEGVTLEDAFGALDKVIVTPGALPVTRSTIVLCGLLALPQTDNNALEQPRAEF